MNKRKKHGFPILYAWLLSPGLPSHPQTNNHFYGKVARRNSPHTLHEEGEEEDLTLCKKNYVGFICYPPNVAILDCNSVMVAFMIPINLYNSCIPPIALVNKSPSSNKRR